MASGGNVHSVSTKSIPMIMNRWQPVRKQAKEPAIPHNRTNLATTPAAKMARSKGELATLTGEMF